MLKNLFCSVFENSIFEKMFDFSDVTANPLVIILLMVGVIVVGVILAVLSSIWDKKRGIMRKTTTRELVFGAICIAMSFVLSFIRIFRLTNAGSITLASVFPLALYCYIFGFNKSMLVCFIFGLLNFFQGPYVTNAWGVLLDYLLPYLAISLVGLFSPNPNKLSSEGKLKDHYKFFIGLSAYFVVRLLSHTLSGAIFWASGVDFWIFQGDLGGMVAFIYSLVYNLTYVLPDTIIVAVAGVFTLSSKTVCSLVRNILLSSSNSKIPQNTEENN